MDLNTFSELFAFEEVSDADSKPGLYAWYLRIKPGKRNIESSENFLKALKGITEQICYPTLTTQLQGHLNMKLQGDLRHIWYGHDENQFSPQFQEILNHPEEREILGQILEVDLCLYLLDPCTLECQKTSSNVYEQHTQLIQRYREEHQENTEAGFSFLLTVKILCKMIREFCPTDCGQEI